MSQITDDVGDDEDNIVFDNDTDNGNNNNNYSNNNNYNNNE